MSASTNKESSPPPGVPAAECRAPHAPVKPTIPGGLVFRACRMSFWVLYDHLGHFIVINLMTVVPGLGLALLADGLGVSLMVTVLPILLWMLVLAGGQGHLINTLLTGHSFEYRALGVGIRQFGLPLALLGLGVSVAIALCVLGIWFYGTVLTNRAPLLGLVLAQFCACSAVGLAMTAFYAVPAVLAHRGAVWPAWCIGVKMVLRHPVGSAGSLVLAVMALVVAVTPPGFVLLSTLPLVTLACCTYELYARAYASAATVGDETDGYLNRGFRDFLYPWKE